MPAAVQHSLFHPWRSAPPVANSDQVVIMGRRPGRIKQVLDVKLPQPRYGYDARAEKEFSRLRSVAWQSLKEEL